MRAIAALAAGVPILLGVVLLCVGTFLAFPLVISVLLSVIGLRPTSFAVFALFGGLMLEVVGFGLIVIGPRIWSFMSRRATD
jgi:hypothetical protein